MKMFLVFAVIGAAFCGGCRSGQSYVVKVPDTGFTEYSAVVVADLTAEAGTVDAARVRIADALARYIDRSDRFERVDRCREGFDPGAGSTLLVGGRIVEHDEGNKVVKIRISLMDAVERRPLAEADFESSVSWLPMDSAYNHVAGLASDYIKRIHAPKVKADHQRRIRTPVPAAMPPAPADPNAPHLTVTPEDVKWAAAAHLTPGAMVAVVEGNPKDAGPYVIRVKLPAGFRIPPHRHSADENAVVLAGTFAVGRGETFDAAAAKELSAGSFFKIPHGVAHFAFAKTETVIQVHGFGPSTFEYVNPAEDPRKAGK